MMAARVGHDVASRVRMAASASTSAALLCQLAADDDLIVRAAVALNQNIPAAAEACLTRDPDGHVRALLGSRLAALCPDVCEQAQPALYERLSKTLNVLARDEAVRVRLALASVLKDIKEAPRDIILLLARDTDLTVSDPVRRLSPVLTREDLLELLSAVPASGVAIAGRSGLDGALCDAVAASADDAAICALLENPSAEIRETTLDRLVQRAADHVPWHAPLVRRPVLSDKATRCLANIVAIDLLEVLASRKDLAPGLLCEVRTRLNARLQSDAVDQGGLAWPQDDPDDADARRFVERLQLFGRLNEEALATSARLAQRRLMAALLGVAADMPARAVQRAMMLRSAKAVISLLWQAGFSTRQCRAVQVLLCQIPPTAALVGRSAEQFPLEPDEMRWQLEFLINADDSGQPAAGKGK